MAPTSLTVPPSTATSTSAPASTPSMTASVPVGGGGGMSGEGGASPVGGAAGTSSGGFGGEPVGDAGSGGAAVNGGSGGGSEGGASGEGGTPAVGGGGQSTAGAGGTNDGDGFSPCPSNGDPCVVLPLGDSITEGYGSSGGGYRVELFRRALQEGKNITFVGTLMNGPDEVDGQPFPRRHQGHGGYTIDSDAGHSGISGQITEQALSMFSPHIVLLMIGTNDLNGNVQVEQAPNRLGNLIDAIAERAPDTLVAVATIIPIENGNGNKVAPYNAAMVDLVANRVAEGKHVILVDNHAAFTSDPSYATVWMGDTLHPNDAGYAVLGESFYEAISGLLTDSP